ncbi:MAG: hypothetical protein H6740_25745 [Alphaproteobacteria bacterium]|nr:hypothetical protein [Alphaproteobacteria bacterium]
MGVKLEARPTECDRAEYRWEASLRPGGFEQPPGPLPAPYEEVLLTTPPLAPGEYDLALKVTAPWGVAQDVHLTVEVVESLDADGDGHQDQRVPGGTDCDDADPAVPSASESPEVNGRDEDCDGRVDEGTEAFDDDRDSFTEAQGDCDDSDPDISPLAKEVSDCRDQDCDGEVDEGVESGC